MIRRENFRLRDWLTGLAVGSVLGLTILGIGSRAGMRLIAVEQGQPGGRSPAAIFSETHFKPEAQSMKAITTCLEYDVDWMFNLQLEKQWL